MIDPCEATLTAEAKSLWTKFYMAWKTTLPLLDSLTVAATRRIPTYAIKLSLVYAALEQTLPAIERDQLAAAIKVAYFGFNCARRLVGERQEFSTQGRCERAIEKALESAALPVWKIHRHIGGRFSAEDVNRAVRALQATGAILVVSKTTRGEPIYSLRGGRREV